MRSMITPCKTLKTDYILQLRRLGRCATTQECIKQKGERKITKGNDISSFTQLPQAAPI